MNEETQSVEAQPSNPENSTATRALRRMTVRTTKILQKRPDPPRELRVVEGQLSWQPPKAVRGRLNVTHYNIYAEHELNLVRQVPADQLFLEDNLVADQVFVSAWNDTMQLESVKVFLLGPIGGGDDIIIGDPEEGDVPIWDEETGSWVPGPPPGAGAGSGTVTSVGLSMPAEFTVTGSPVDTAGTLAVNKQTQAANRVWAGPASGAATVPVFRALTAADMPAGFVMITVDGVPI